MNNWPKLNSGNSVIRLLDTESFLPYYIRTHKESYYYCTWEIYNYKPRKTGFFQQLKESFHLFLFRLTNLIIWKPKFLTEEKWTVNLDNVYSSSCPLCNFGFEKLPKKSTNLPTLLHNTDQFIQGIA